MNFYNTLVKLAATAAISISVMGCASRGTLLENPKTHATFICQNQAYGTIAVFSIESAHQKCVELAKTAGYTIVKERKE